MKYNWSEFRVYIPNEGFRLVSQLTNKEAKDHLCSIIELVESLASLHENGLKLINVEK